MHYGRFVAVVGILLILMVPSGNLCARGFYFSLLTILALLWCSEKTLAQTSGVTNPTETFLPLSDQSSAEGYVDYTRLVFNVSFPGSYYPFYYYNYPYVYGIKYRKYLTDDWALRVSISGSYQSNPYSYSLYQSKPLSNYMRSGTVSIRGEFRSILLRASA